MTNYEAIKNMSPEEMARFLCRHETGFTCEDCTANNKQACKYNVEMLKDWLNEESEE